MPVLMDTSGGGGGADGEGGGGEGGGGDGCLTRGPQSLQSCPHVHPVPVEPVPPSWHSPLLRPTQELEHSRALGEYGGSAGGGRGGVMAEQEASGSSSSGSRRMRRE